MRINKVILLLVIPLMVELMVACCFCFPTMSFNYSNCSLEIQNLDNRGEKAIVSESNSFSKQAFGIRVLIQRERNACTVIGNNSIFFKSAYASSCECPPTRQYLPLDNISSIKIFSKRDFDSEHFGNSEISNYFSIFTGNDFFQIEEYLNNTETTLYDFGNPWLEFDLLLMSPPTIGTEHQFSLEIELTDGRILDAQTETLELN